MTTTDKKYDLILSNQQQTQISPVISYFARMTESSALSISKALKRIVILINPQLDVKNFPWQQLKPEHSGIIRGKLQQLVTDDKLAPDSANLSLKALRGVIKECWRLGLINEDVLRRVSDIPTIKGTRVPTGKHVEISKIQGIISQNSQNELFKTRNLALFAILVGCGLRRSELSQITLNDVLTSNSIKIIGKGNKQRIVYLPNWAERLVSAWIKMRGGASDGYLICKIGRGKHTCQTNKQISTEQVQKIVEKLAGKDIKPHDLRRTFIGNLLDAGVDISTVSQMAGHSQVTTTAKYDRRTEQRKIDAIKLMNF